jgi:MFS family permease
MIAKIIPVDRHGTFFGFQSAFANLFASGSGVLAGLLLERLDLPLNYTLCFALAGLAMAFSYFFLALTREPLSPVEEVSSPAKDFYRSLTSILKARYSLPLVLVVRGLSQFSVVAFSFYTVYAVRYMGMNEATAGLMMGVYTFGQIAANPNHGLGWRPLEPSGCDDHWCTRGYHERRRRHHCTSVELVLPGIHPCRRSNVSIWTIGLAMTLQFGSLAERPAYIGLANTLVAPVTILAPLFGGWLADYGGFEYTFILSAVCGLITAIVLSLTLRSPRQPFRKRLFVQRKIDFH